MPSRPKGTQPAAPRSAKGRFPPGNGQGRGGDANGPGWGGPAQGEGQHLGQPDPFAPGNTLGHIATPERRREAQEDREEALAFYREVMRDKQEATVYRLAASEKLMDRQEGKALARNLNVNTDEFASLTDAELDAELARIDATRPGEPASF